MTTWQALPEQWLPSATRSKNASTSSYSGVLPCKSLPVAAVHVTNYMYVVPVLAVAYYIYPQLME